MAGERPIQIVQRRAYERSAEFIEQNISKALLFGRKVHLHNHVGSLVTGSGLVLECGVYQGRSINHMARLLPDRTLHGFDSFEGLSENWSGNHHAAGHFDLSGQLPQVEPNVTLIKGWLDDTFAPFLKDQNKKIDYLHIDTDTYTPAKLALTAALPWMHKGTVILFDELFGYPGWEEHEYKALNETLPRACYDFVGFSQEQAALVITKKP